MHDRNELDAWSLEMTHVNEVADAFKKLNLPTGAEPLEHTTPIWIFTS